MFEDGGVERDTQRKRAAGSAADYACIFRPCRHPTYTERVGKAAALDSRKPNLPWPQSL